MHESFQRAEALLARPDAPARITMMQTPLRFDAPAPEP